MQIIILCKLLPTFSKVQVRNIPLNLYWPCFPNIVWQFGSLLLNSVLEKFPWNALLQKETQCSTFKETQNIQWWVLSWFHTNFSEKPCRRGLKNLGLLGRTLPSLLGRTSSVMKLISIANFDLVAASNQ